MSSSATIKVSKTTMTELENLRKQLNARSMDEIIKLLIKRHKMQALRAALGTDTGRLSPFTEEDRGGDR